MPALIAPETIAAIHTAADIADLVSDHVVLRKSGASLRGACPFHRGTNRTAFQVSPERGSYFCHSCHKSGDAIQFVVDLDGSSFTEAVQYLASRYRVPVKLTEPEKQVAYERQQTERQQLLEVMAVAAEYYRKQLMDRAAGATARDYIVKRGITPQTAKDFGLGYAPAGWHGLYDFLSLRGVSVQLMELAGLIKANDQRTKFYDRFRDRIIIPIRDVRGQVIGFGGRAMGDAEPKYLNSPETVIFNKSEVLFGMDRAKDAIAKQDRGILVEGYFDVMALHQAGVAEVVATMGTAVTAGHLRQVAKRTQSKVVILNFDGDTAGVQTVTRAAATLTDGAINDIALKVITLPTGKDADEYLSAHDGTAYQALADNAPLYFDWQLQRIVTAHDLGQADQFARASELVTQLISTIDADSPLRSHYHHKAAALLAQHQPQLAALVTKDLGKRLNHQRWYGNQSQVSPLVASRATPTQVAEEHILRMFCHHASCRQEIFALVEQSDLTFSRGDYLALWQGVLSLVDANADLQAADFEERLRLVCAAEPEANRLLHYLLSQPVLPRPVAAVRVALAHLAVIHCKARLEVWTTKIKAVGNDLGQLQRLHEGFSKERQQLVILEKALLQADQEPGAVLEEDEIF